MKFFLVKIKGIVQGVGFRPYIYRKCASLRLKGYVKNTGDGVELVIDDKEVLPSILSDLPPLAKVEDYTVNEIDADFNDFKILHSAKDSKELSVAPDIAICDDCLKEMRDKNNRRYRYFFITCTNCGPRFSIIEDVPYDRENTSMKDFGMCPACRREYENPENRRYHAQTIACYDCGPKLTYISEGKEQNLEHAIDDLLQGKIIAMKGIGGFHFACLAEDAPVRELRKITGRPKKPFAIMVKDMETAKALCEINEAEQRLLESPQRPIVTLKKRDPKALAFVSELDSLGIMLPYTPLHYLIFEKIDAPLVMTSSNMPGEPMTTEDREQFVKNILTHNRRITNRIDDSVMKVIDGRNLFLRRSRGFVPTPIRIESDYGGTILALGAEMNNTISVYRNGNVFVSQYMGDTANHKTFEAMKKSAEKFLRLLNAKPDIIACDLHPHYNTTLYAEELSKKLSIPLVKVQHHKAHAASVLLEKGIEKAVSVVCDGTGYGSEGKIWGGEVFLGDERIGSLEEHIMPGGEAAVRHPWRMLAGILSSFLEENELEKEMRQFCTKKEFSVIYNQIQQKFNSPYTTSCGRILDAASAFLGLCRDMHYDGRPAMLLESIAGKPYDLEPSIKDGERLILETRPLFEFLIDNKDKDKGRLAATVHNYLAEGLIEIAERAGKSLPKTFSGGVAYNRHITKRMLEAGFLINEKVPAGDGGVSFGQVGWAIKD
ncbi:MAG: carbamoyltransferase HypF [Candidatus Micrarchaeota archaeon]|nr:carbamoyltransferase HypF [Candidatus Micrarchaeota archaeon]